MTLLQRIALLHPDMMAWRRDLHAHPETAFEEVRTSAFVAEKLAAFGLEVARGIGRTGVVGTLRAGSAGRAIGLRADMDALHVVEQNDFAHRSRHAGRMHACGHDGHTAMLLGAARHLAATRAFDGTVHFIFQPAEENEGGGRAMVEDGLFERFPCDAVYGLHNWPGLPVGQFAVMPGPMMASFDIFEIVLAGRGAHAAMPHLGVDPVVAGSALVQALQTIPSRTVSPVDAAVVSVTQFHAGDTWNVIPAEAVLRGTTLPPTMGAEDFAFMLQQRPGAYAWIGNGPGTGGCVLHNPRYDFNDDVLPLGAAYWVALTEQELPRA
jgi:hippurate hydrolase